MKFKGQSNGGEGNIDRGLGNISRKACLSKERLTFYHCDKTINYLFGCDRQKLPRQPRERCFGIVHVFSLEMALHST